MSENQTLLGVITRIERKLNAIEARLDALEKAMPTWARHRGYMTTKEAARFLSCSYKTLEQMRADNEGPPYGFFTPTKGIRYDIQELVAYMETSKVCPGRNVSRVGLLDENSIGAAA